jgi:probable phosphoglycerate mutase
VKSFRLFITRSGETEWSRARRFTGPRDVALTDLGRRQSEAAAQALAGEALVGVHASPAEPARAAAEMIAKPHRLEIALDEDLREMGFGEWEGLTGDEAGARTPALYAGWREAPDRMTPPGGEPLAAVAARVGRALARLRARDGAGPVVVVTHAIVARLLVLEALGLGPGRLWSVDASPAGITEIEYQTDWATVHRMNTLAHLHDV